MQRVLERTSSGAAWNFPSEYFSVENCLSKKSKVVLCEVMTNLSTRLQSVAGGLEIQLGNLWTVSLRGCHRRALWPHSAPVLGLPCEGHFSQSTMVTWLPLPWWHGIVSAREGTMLHHERCGPARNVSSQGTTGTQSIPATTPTGEHFWTEMEGSWPKIFIVWWNLNIFHGKRKQKHNNINNNKKKNNFQPTFIQSGFEKSQGLSFY